ncbi:hypothetical protein [Acidianus sp. HS-5]|uniref:hypothetical protein n=1 Tax=Acidianus sp. HS-5 TaxID=2886040 RepID=UPI001F356D2D|nr:hypothetical protein [Acidianus sp. HS-5]BDC17787.1 hypothetical protein HS5_06770 [Acidianus sp. HS-5]
MDNPPHHPPAYTGGSASSSSTIYIFILNKSFMHFLGIDTSGDHDVTSPYVIGYVISDDSSSIEKSNIGKAVDEARKTINKQNYVFHAYHDDKRVREVFLDSLIKYNVKGRVIVLLDRNEIKRKLLALLSKVASKSFYVTIMKYLIKF